MTRKSVTSMAVVAGCTLALAIPVAQAQMADTPILAAAPQTNPGDYHDSAAAARNVAQSRAYMRQLQTNPGFREARIDRECGPITDAQLHASCVASFDHFTPFVGSTRLAGNAWYPPNPQISTTQPHIIEHGLTGSGTGTMGMGTTGGATTDGTHYGAGAEMTPHRAPTLAPIPDQTGPEPWYSNRNYPGQGSSVPLAGAAPTYPGSRISGPMSGNGGGAGQ